MLPTKSPSTPDTRTPRRWRPSTWEPCSTALVIGTARAAYQLAVDSRHKEHTPRAAVNLGDLLRAAGDLKGARTAYQLAIDSGHPDHAPHGAVALSRMLDSRFWWRQDAYVSKSSAVSSHGMLCSACSASSPVGMAGAAWSHTTVRAE